MRASSAALIDRCHPCDSRRSRVRVGSQGFDPVLCGIGAVSNPGQSLIKSAMRIPVAPTSRGPIGEGEVLVEPYLFQCATIKLPPRQCIEVVGLGQIYNIGEVQTQADSPPVYPLVSRVTTPTWTFPDCMAVEWALRIVRQPPLIPWAGQNVLSTDTFAWRWSESSALVYETATFAAANLNWNGTPDNYVALSGYTAPWAGQIPGEPVGNLGSFRSLDYPWDDPDSANFEPITVEGPGALVLYAKVWQSLPNNREISSSRPLLQVPVGINLQPAGIPEDSLIANFPGIIGYSIGGWIEVER